MRIAVIGAGPAGFYASDKLLAAGFDVDLLDSLPTPFGLVRSGVAPDHPNIKAVTRVYEKTAAKPGFRFFGGDALAATDVADHALGPLAEAQVQEVVLLGRRGPAQAAFTNPELRELGEMTGVDVQVDPAEVDVEIPDDLSPTGRRNVEILKGYADRPPGSAGRRISLKFLRSPVEILGEGPD